MKNILTLLFLFVTVSLHAQITADQIKTGLTGKEWKISKYEVFGVAEAAKPEQSNDKILLNADMTFTIVDNGKTYKGKWSILNPVEYISCKATTGSWTKMYKVISIGEKASVIQFKDADLIKTNYYLEVK
ncbi:MAG TPA: hypothetical protein VNW06_06485 [Cytophagaceae bacterium]|jgi:hypothetical protein|nr:hypothetical protein [Cytophagaceae bacterium]